MITLDELRDGVSWKNEIILGDCREVLRALPEKSVHCMVTSPPYYNLRSYGTDPLIWDADPDCDHEWKDSGKKICDQYCLKCNAWKGHLGNEPTVDAYVRHMVHILGEVKRVLRDDGVVWINIGSTYMDRDIESDEMVLREDLSDEEIKYVFDELGKNVQK